MDVDMSMGRRTRSRSADPPATHPGPSMRLRTRNDAVTPKTLMFSVFDIDSETDEPPLMLGDSAEVHANDLTLEVTRSISPDLLGSATCAPSSRSVLLNWLVDVHLLMRESSSETLFLTVNLIDRFLATSPVPSNEIQLLGIGALRLASKYEDAYVVGLEDMVYLSAQAYTSNQIVEMETRICRQLDFRFAIASSRTFLNRFARVANVLKEPRTEIELFASYLTELSLFQPAVFYKFTPSVVAAAALYFSFSVFQQPWPLAFELQTIYTKQGWAWSRNIRARLSSGRSRMCPRFQPLLSASSCHRSLATVLSRTSLPSRYKSVSLFSGGEEVRLATQAPGPSMVSPFVLYSSVMMLIRKRERWYRGAVTSLPPCMFG